MKKSPTSLRVRIDELDPKAWTDSLLSFADASIYQTWAYADVRTGRRVSRCVVEADGRVIALAQFRIARTPLLPIGVAQAFWGPVWRARGEESDEQSFREIMTAIEEEYVNSRGLVVRVIPNAFEETPEGEAVKTLLPMQGYTRRADSRAYRTLRLDLTPSLDELRSGLAQKWRNQLNRSERNELTVITGPDVELYDRFLGLYGEMRMRKSFTTGVSAEEFREIQCRADSRCQMQCFVCVDEGQDCAAVVVSAIGDTGIYLLGASNKTGMKEKGSYLLHWHVMDWLKQQGCRWYDLGGINPEENPGVYHFKKGFSGRDSFQVGQFERAPSKLARTTIVGVEKIRARLRALRSS